MIGTDSIKPFYAPLQQGESGQLTGSIALVCWMIRAAWHVAWKLPLRIASMTAQPENAFAVNMASAILCVLPRVIRSMRSTPFERALSYLIQQGSCLRPLTLNLFG